MTFISLIVKFYQMLETVRIIVPFCTSFSYLRNFSTNRISYEPAYVPILYLLIDSICWIYRLRWIPELIIELVRIGRYLEQFFIWLCHLPTLKALQLSGLMNQLLKPSKHRLRSLSHINGFKPIVWLCMSVWMSDVCSWVLCWSIALVSGSHHCFKGAREEFEGNVRRLQTPLSVSNIATTWDECARNSLNEYAHQQGGGNFATTFGVWESILTIWFHVFPPRKAFAARILSPGIFSIGKIFLRFERKRKRLQECRTS